MTLDQYASLGEIVAAIAVVASLIYVARLKWAIQHFGRRKAVREAWVQFRGSFDVPYQGFVEEQFSIADGKA